MKATKRQLEILNRIKQCEKELNKDLYVVYNQYKKCYVIADLKEATMRYDIIDTIKTTVNTLYNMIDNNLLVTKEVNGIKLTTTIK